MDDLPTDQYFTLIVPASVLLLGLGTLACWLALRQQRFLIWLGAGYILPALALSAQTLMDNAQLARWSVVTGALYLAGSWAIARSLALRYDGRIPNQAALAIALPTLALLYYYAFVVDALEVRAFWLGTGMALMQILPLRCMLRSPLHQLDPLERVVRYSYLVHTAYVLARPVLIYTLIPMDSGETLTQSGYWRLMLAGTLLLGIWFVAMLIACAVRDTLRVLRDERNRDPLTRLLNRRAFFESAEQALQTSRRGPWALLACDVDHFKRVNDTWGHAAGDHVLHGVAQMLLAQVRRGDLIARFGGEEFLVLLSYSTQKEAYAVAQRMQAALAQMSFSPIPNTVTASFGMTAVASLRDLPSAIERADAALYQAKQTGRNRICTAPAAVAALLPGA